MEHHDDAGGARRSEPVAEAEAHVSAQHRRSTVDPAHPDSRVKRAVKKGPSAPHAGGRRPLSADLALLQFSSLPDEALIPLRTLAALTAEGQSTLLRKARTDPRLQIVSLGFHSKRFRVGGVRAYMRDGALPKDAGTKKGRGGAK
jgi:hypothetical protein